MNKIVSRHFYERDTIIVAQELLGKKLVRIIGTKTLAGLIVETEAYTANDAACHAYRGKTTSNQALFGPVGHAYIYFIYGNHYCLNAVAHTKEQRAGGVLIRALEPIENSEQMQQYRNQQSLKNLTNGPGKLAQALHITKALYGIDLTHKGPLYISEGISVDPHDIRASERIGITKNSKNLWRFFIENNGFVSR